MQTACFVDVESAGRIVYAILNRFNGEWRSHAL